MNKIKIYLLSIGLLLIMPIKVFALTGSIDISCTPTTANPGATVTCNLTGNSDEGVASLEIPFTVTNASVTNFVSDAVWFLPDDVSNGKVEESSSSENGTSGSFNIGTFTLTINNGATGTATLAFSDVIFSDANLTEHSVAGKTATITISVPSNPTGLTNLEATGGVLGPPFTSSGTEYILTLSQNTTKFSFSTLTPATSSDEINITNADTGQPLGSNNITFETESGKTSMRINISVGTGDRNVVYHVTVQKEIPAETGQPTLSSITVAGQSVTIANQMDVELSDVSNYQVVASLSDSSNYTFDLTALGSSCSITNNTLTCKFTKAGSYSIKVISNTSGGSSKSYILNVTKKAGGSASENHTNGQGSGNGNATNNPRTGGGIAASIVALMLVVSLGMSIHLYKKNMQNFNN